MSASPEVVVCAANRHRESGVIILGARHYDGVMRQAMQVCGGFPYWRNCDQGFINQRGEFLTRERALEIARANGQVKYECGNGTANTELFSENLY